MKKELWVTVDYYDDVLGANRHYSERDLDAMMKYISCLGTARVQWILDTIWTFYDANPPGGFDLLKAACDAAHRHGMRFGVVFKPFEGALAGALVLPDALPIPENAPVLKESTGLIHAYRQHVAEHPEMNLARLAGADEDPGGRIKAIRLVKNDDAPAPFGQGDLSIWTNPRNGGYTKYAGPVSFDTGTGWRMIFPYGNKPCRIVNLGNLDLPAGTRFVMVRRERGSGIFTNAVEHIIELVNEREEIIPSTPALRTVDGPRLFELFGKIVRLKLTHFACTAEAQAIAQDSAGFLKLCEGMRRFDAGWENAALEEGGTIVAMRGKARHRTGAMHPIYKEVRKAWLDTIRCCIEWGVDSVNIRTECHNRAYEPYLFGFNAPVAERMEHPGNIAEARRINGEAYTRFLREAADLLHASGRELGVHVNAVILHHDDRAANNSPVPLNFDWQWERWLKDIADFVEYRGSFHLRPENQAYVADRIGLAAREAGIPFVYQSLRGNGMVRFEGPHHALVWEMDRARAHPDVAVYNLYEIAAFSRFDPERGFEGSPDIAGLVKNHWRK
jgi:hypothetical protein